MANREMNFLRNLSLLTYIGLSMTIPIAVGVYLGNILDERMHTESIFLLICVVLGIAASFLNVYKIVMKSIDKK